ncbi:putative PWWP domain containing protein PWWP2 [Dioscorea sansibarensis]
MESSDGWAAVGAIVWVRRRNGSWWPGRILGPGELAESHLLSPRSGTPVKLLGREDASVDWYNLEKSKRVKPFRCGEFDACIKKAEASQKIPIKKREKYARREDAILHALQLEKQQSLGTNSSCLSNNSLGALKREKSHCSSSDIHRPCSSNQTSQTLSRRVTSSPEEDDLGRSLYVENTRNFKAYKDDPYAAILSSSGLQDFDLPVVPPKSKLSQSVSLVRSQRSTNAFIDALPVSGSMGVVSCEDSEPNSLVYQGKRSHGSRTEETTVKRCDRRQPLAIVLQNSTGFPDSQFTPPSHDSGTIPIQVSKDHIGVIHHVKRSRCVYQPADAIDSPDQLGHPSKDITATALRFGRDASMNRGKRSRCISLTADTDDSSDQLELSCEETATKANHLVMDNNHYPPAYSTEESTDSSSSEADESDSSATDSMEAYIREEASLPAGKNGNKKNKGMPPYNIMPQSHSRKQIGDDSAEVGTSMWHLKGNYDIQNLGRRSMNDRDENIHNIADAWDGSSDNASYESEEANFKIKRMGSSGRSPHKKRKFDHYFDEAYQGASIDSYLGNPSHPLALQEAKDSSTDFDDDRYMVSMSRWEADEPSHVVRRKYWEESEECSSPVYAGQFRQGRRPMLIDVDLEVQARYQREHVPWVSMMSRLNGKSIVGHPIHVEILEDGSADLLVSRRESNLSGSTPSFSFWTTAKRTAKQRTPRSIPAASAFKDKDPELFEHTNLKSKHPMKNAHSVLFNQESRLGARGTSHLRRSSSTKSQRKVSKRTSLSSQKTCALSSFSGVSKRHGEIGDFRFTESGDALAGLIRPEGSVPLVTCVPVKVAFSRILESIGRQPSSGHRVLNASYVARSALHA